MNILEKIEYDALNIAQKTEMKIRLNQVQEWISTIKLTDIKNELDSICGYDTSHLTGIAFEMNYNDTYIPIPNILKQYITDLSEVSINKAKAYLLSLYILKISMNIKTLELIDPDYLKTESIYFFLKSKMQSIIPYHDKSIIDSAEDIPTLLEKLSNYFIPINNSTYIHLQNEIKPIKSVDKETMLNILSSDMKNRWAVHFMFSQGFFILSAICLLQWIFNNTHLPLFVTTLILSFIVTNLTISAIILTKSTKRAYKDVDIIRNMRSNEQLYTSQQIPVKAEI